MPVRERESTGAVVIRGGNVLPGGGVRVIDEVSVVNRIRVFVDHQPGSRGPRHLGLLEVLLKLGKAPVEAVGRGIVARAEPAED